GRWVPRFSQPGLRRDRYCRGSLTAVAVAAPKKHACPPRPTPLLQLCTPLARLTRRVCPGSTPVEQFMFHRDRFGPFQHRATCVSSPNVDDRARAPSVATLATACEHRP